jgi:hypothetical protein
VAITYDSTYGGGGLIAGFAGGESLDVLVDAGTCYGTYTTLLAGWSIVTSPVKTGVGAWRCNVNGSQENGSDGGNAFRLLYLSQPTATWYHAAWMEWVTLSGNPAAAFAILGDQVADGDYALEVGTDRKVRLVKLGAGANRWSGRVSKSDWSTKVLPNDDSTFMHMAVFFTAIGSPQSDCRVWLVLDEVEQWRVDVGESLGRLVTMAWVPCPPIGSVNAGIYVTHDDMCGLKGAAGDSPTTTAWPKPGVHRQLAISDVAANWTASGGGAGSYVEWDDAAGNDGDTTRNYASASLKTQYGKGQTAATMGITGHTIIHAAGDASRAPLFNAIYKSAGAGTKWGVKPWNGYGTGSETEIIDRGTSYAGEAQIFDCTGSPYTWAAADVGGLNFGMQTLDPIDRLCNVTLCMMQWLTYITTLPLVSAPTGRRRVFVC